MFFLLKAAFWLSLVFFVVRYDAGDGQDRSVAIAQVPSLSEARTSITTLTQQGKALASHAQQACEIVGTHCPDHAKTAINLAAKASQLAQLPSQHTLVSSDLAAAPWGGEAAPRAVAQPQPQKVITAPLPLPRRPA